MAGIDLRSSTSQSGAYALKGSMPYGGRGQLVLILDDCRISHKNIALPALASYGWHCTLAVNSDAIGGANNMTGADLVAAAAAGHELAAHSKTHTDMTSLTATQRVTEWNTPKSTLEALIGTTVTTWVYPFNASNAACEVECYSRYDRSFVGPVGPIAKRLGDRSQFVTGRYSWNDMTHGGALDFVRRVAAGDRVGVIFTHDVDGTNLSSGVTQAEFNELLALCSTLGVEVVRADQGIPAHRPVPNKGFETTDLSAWTLTTVGTGTISVVADTPATGLGGVNSLAIVGDNTGQQTATLILPLEDPTVPITASVHAHHNRTAGTGGTAIIVKEYDLYGTQLAQNNGSQITAAGASAWTQLTAAFTPNAATRTIGILLNQSTLAGTSWYDNLHVGPTRYGVLG